MKKIKTILSLFLMVSLISCSVTNTEVKEKSDKEFVPSPKTQVQKNQVNCDPPEQPCDDWLHHFDESTLLQPQNNSFQETSVYFSWENDSNNPSFAKYSLIIDDNSSFQYPEFVFDDIVSESKTVYGLNRNTKYYWKVITYGQDPNGDPMDTWITANSEVRTVRIRPQSSNLNGSLYQNKPQLSWTHSNGTSKLFRESYASSIQSAFFSFNNIGSHVVAESQFSQDFIMPQNAQLFNTISYHVVNYNSQGWPSLRSNYVFYEIDEGGGGFGGF